MRRWRPRVRMRACACLRWLGRAHDLSRDETVVIASGHITAGEAVVGEAEASVDGRNSLGAFALLRILIHDVESRTGYMNICPHKA